MLSSLFAIVLVLIWGLMLSGSWNALANQRLAPSHWHAHEMIFGYGMAVITGFLLTAVRNWTGQQTLSGTPLLALACLWLAARVLAFVPVSDALLLFALLDTLFSLLLCIIIFLPIARARQWKQMGIWSKLVFLLAGNLMFWLGIFGILENGARLGLYTGFYIIVSLIMLMGRRVIPFFIEKGLDNTVSLKNFHWLDMSSLVLMLVFLVAEVWYPLPALAAATALLLGILHLLRLILWHRPGLWRQPLLWVLYLGYAWLVTGFFLLASARYLDTPPQLAIHAFAYGCIGMITIGMMARVSLAHSGRNINNPPGILGLVFALMFAGAVVRVLAPLFAQGYYLSFIYASQGAWLLAFVLFCWRYFGVFTRPAPSADNNCLARQ